MNSTEASAPSTSINIADGKTETRIKETVPPYRFLFAKLRRDMKTPGGWKRGLAVFDFFLRLLAISAFVAAAVSMGTDNEMLQFFTKDYQFYANFADFPSLTYVL